MPIFEFICTNCGATSEHLVFTSPEPVKCPQCQSPELRKLLSVTSSASGVKNPGRVPGMGDTACCGSQPGAQGCVPGSCCGKSH